MEYINIIVDHPYFQQFLIYSTTLFGAVAMYIFSLKKGLEGAVPFLKRFFPDRADVFYDRADFFLVTISGSIIGTLFFTPSSPVEALAAGFGWVGAVNVLMKEENK